MNAKKEILKIALWYTLPILVTIALSLTGVIPNGEEKKNPLPPV